ncbi:MAG: hypothetical protein JW893_00470, partial [Candidatus Omnitrophica bacterium]|nr:hypothetical protein [Candidatus Omnitrophota bacterium]
GVNLSQVRLIYFIVEGTNQTGTLTINNKGPVAQPELLQPVTTDTSTISIFPMSNDGRPMAMTSVGPGVGGASDLATWTGRAAHIDYNTGDPAQGAGWAGGGFAYDDFSTTTVEGGNLTALPELRFGIKGDVSQLKFEVVDYQGNKASLYIGGILPDTEQVWAIPRSLLTGVDWSRISIIYFIVEGANLEGSFEISNVPTA